MPFPPSFDHVWDITQPPDTQQANLLGQDIRNFKDDIMQRFSLLSGTTANRPTPETLNATWGGVGFGILFFATDTGKIWQWSGAGPAWVDVTSNFIVPPSNTSQIVATLSLTAQGANIAPTTLYAVPVGSPGFYRISAYIVLTRPATASSTLPDFIAIWTDFDTSVVSSSNFLATRSNNLLGDHSPQVGFDGNTIMYVLGGTNFQYQVAGYASSGATTMQYALRAKLEFLGP